MKKIIILLSGVAALVGLGFFAIHLSNTEKVSDDLSLIDFAVQDTASVDKIEVYDSFHNRSFIVKRGENGQWVDNDGNCVKQELVQTMLETFLKVTLKGYVPEGAMENMKKQMMAKYKKVDIYQDGRWKKTWYVGHSTSDHYGTHMLLETPNKKSDHPVIMGMKGFYGILEPRFSADPKEFKCSQLFDYKREDIREVKVENFVNPSESFEIQQAQNGIEATSNGQPIEELLTDNLLFYLNGFQNIHFNQPNYTYNEKQVDSIKALSPDYTLTIKTKKDDFFMPYFRRPDPDAEQKDSLVWDQDYLWGIAPSGELVRMQYFTVGPLIFGKDIFMKN